MLTRTRSGRTHPGTLVAACLILWAGGPAAPVYAQGGGLAPAPVTAGPDVPPATTPPGLDNQPAVTRFIRVTGYGVIQRKPDEAHISFLVSTTETSALKALKDNSDLVTGVVNGLQKFGVPQDNIVPSQSALTGPVAPAAGAPGAEETPIEGSVEPVTSPTKYTASARVLVVTYQVPDVSTIVQIGMYNGATSVLGIKFEAHNLQELKQEALIGALKDAASKAQILSLGVKARILYAISVSELPAPPTEIPGAGIAPPAEISVPMNIEVVYAIG